MNDTLIVYGHPSQDGHCGFFLQELKRALDLKQERYEVLDLYALGFDPVLKVDEHYASGHSVVTPQNREIQDKIKHAKRLAFIYPIWWQNMPAIVKGFVDRVLVAGFAFRYRDNGFPEGLLLGKRAAVFTSAGAPRFVTRFLSGDRGLKVMVNDTLRFCGMKAQGFAVGSASQLTPKNKVQISKAVARGVAFLV